MTNNLKAKVLILPKNGLRDPQGETIKKTLQLLSPSLLHVAKGSLIELTFDTHTSKQDAEIQLQKICNDILVNPLIEQFKIEWSETSADS